VASPPFAPDELGARSRRALDGLRPAQGQDRLVLFVEEADRYAERLDSSWALPYGFPQGTVPAGAHAALAALEYHLRAWDLSGGAHRPADPRALLVAARRTLYATRPGPAGRLGEATAPLVGRHRAWERTLEWAERVPAAGRSRRPQGLARPENN
jgi:hypothetical protein